jgi:hypothetical protein
MGLLRHLLLNGVEQQVKVMLENHRDCACFDNACSTSTFVVLYILDLMVFQS